GVALLEHVDECPVGAALDRGGGHHYRLPQRVDEDANVHKLTGPKLKVAIWELGPQLHRAGGLIDLIVDYYHLAFVERALALGTQGVDRQHAFGHALGEFRQILLRQAEEHRDRPQLREDHDSCRFRAAHEVAGVDQTDARAAGDRRDDFGVGQNGARVVNRRLVELDLRLELRNQGSL